MIDRQPAEVRDRVLRTLQPLDDCWIDEGLQLHDDDVGVFRCIAFRTGLRPPLRHPARHRRVALIDREDPVDRLRRVVVRFADALVEPCDQETVVESIVLIADRQAGKERVQNANAHAAHNAAKADQEDQRIRRQRPPVMDLLPDLRQFDEQEDQDQDQQHSADREQGQLLRREIVRRDRKTVLQFRYVVRRQRGHALRQDDTVDDPEARPQRRKHREHEQFAFEQHRQRDRCEHDQHVDQEDQRMHEQEREPAVDRLSGQRLRQQHDQERRSERNADEVVQVFIEESPCRRPLFARCPDAPRP